jgi:outer membrane protein assembly factor BamA
LGHFSAGIILNYGNSAGNPYTEKFYAGGANSVRAFSLRSFGPGSYDMDELGKWEFLFRMGDMKLLGNLELRSRLFGNLYGALFLDAGNVWSVDSSEDADEGTTFKLKNLPEQLAVGTGVGLRYDLDFFVIRLDWGIGIHLPYDTGKSGFYNIPKFRDGQALHLAIGYPF